MEAADPLTRLIALGPITAAGILAHVLPQPSTPRSRMLEVLAAAVLLLGTTRWLGFTWYACLAPFSTASFLLVRLLRTIDQQPSQVPESSNAASMLGAHPLYVGPLLALTTVTLWSVARGGHGFAWPMLALVTFNGVTGSGRTYRAAAASSVIILSGSAALMP